ncbi:MAG: TIR domain-containing protein [Sphingobacteriales bacterium]|nr:MAG: TIR domain-containing protein [Sphingobacteriales bacterium]
MEKACNVFISHHHADDEHIGKMKDLLAAKGYQLKNSSIDSSKPNRIISDEAIKRLLRLRISWAGTFICLIGPDTHNRPWVDWEIDEAFKKGKRIIGVFAHGAKDSDVPENFKLYGNALVGWNSDKIIDAIEGRLNNSENSDGSPKERSWDVEREIC